MVFLFVIVIVVFILGILLFSQDALDTDFFYYLCLIGLYFQAILLFFRYDRISSFLNYHGNDVWNLSLSHINIFVVLYVVFCIPFPIPVLLSALTTLIFGNPLLFLPLTLLFGLVQTSIIGNEIGAFEDLEILGGIVRYAVPVVSIIYSIIKFINDVG